MKINSGDLRVRASRWGKLTEDDFKTAAGKKENLVGRIQERYGIAKEEAEKQAIEWSAALKEYAREVPLKCASKRAPSPSKQIWRWCGQDKSFVAGISSSSVEAHRLADGPPTQGNAHSFPFSSFLRETARSLRRKR